MDYISGVSAAQDWLQGQAAAIFGGMGFARQALASQVPADAIQVLAAPIYGPRRANPSPNCLGLAIPAGSQASPEAAWALLEWLALGEPAGQRFASGQGLPANRRSLNDAPLKGAGQEKLTRWQQQLAALVQKEVFNSQAFCIQTSPYLDGDHVALTWSRQEERFLSGELNLDQMLAAVEAEVHLAFLTRQSA